MELAVALSPRDWMLITLVGLGPLGAAFFLWDKALKLGDPRHIAILSYLTPLLSTAMLVGVRIGISTARVPIRHRRIAINLRENPRFASLPARSTTRSAVQERVLGCVGHADRRSPRSKSESPV
jgi:hypothetical protein